MFQTDKWALELLFTTHQADHLVWKLRQQHGEQLSPPVSSYTIASALASQPPNSKLAIGSVCPSLPPWPSTPGFLKAVSHCGSRLGLQVVLIYHVTLHKVC